ncbi:MAG TPA: glycosyltransferase family 1 protein [Mycobacteriales bacterium]|nr:glycosyltransferase family 1 protein [Mycobacteriales bacterium]
MRLGVLVEQVLAPVPGGTGRYARELAAALAATAPPGATVTGWSAWHRDPGPARIPGVAGPRRLPVPRRGLVAAWERGLGPGPYGLDVLHAPTPLAPPRRRTPLVVTVHDAVPWSHPGTLTPRGVAWHRGAIAAAVRTADRIVVPTHAVAAELAAQVPDWWPEKVTVVGEGVPDVLRTPPPDAADRAARLDLPPAYLLSLATLEPRKGLDTLLAALADPAAPDLPLLLVGQPGWGGVDPLDQARALGLAAGRVRVLGRLPDLDLAVVLHRAAALASPSRAEGFGLPLLEAMAAGVPVVTSDAPALVEVGGGAAVVVPRDDPAALARGLAEVLDPADRTTRVAAGRARADHYSWSIAARELWQLYSTLGT